MAIAESLYALTLGFTGTGQYAIQEPVPRTGGLYADKTNSLTSTIGLMDSNSNHDVSGIKVTPTQLEFNRSRIGFIRASLGVQIKELADMLQVSRPAIYSWINGENKISEKNHKRFRLLHNIAKKWSEISDLPMKSILRRIDTDDDIMSYLKTKELSLMEFVKRSINIHRLSVQNKNTKKPLFNMRKTAESKGYKFNNENVRNSEYAIFHSRKITLEEDDG